MSNKNRKARRQGPPAWMPKDSSPAKLPPMETMIADVDEIAGADAVRVEEYAPPANAYIFAGRDFGFDKFVTQEGAPHTEEDMIREIDRVAWVPENIPPMKIHVLSNRLRNFALFAGCHV